MKWLERWAVMQRYQSCEVEHGPCQAGLIGVVAAQLGPAWQFAIEGGAPDRSRLYKRIEKRIMLIFLNRRSLDAGISAVGRAGAIDDGKGPDGELRDRARSEDGLARGARPEEWGFEPECPGHARSRRRLAGPARG